MKAIIARLPEWVRHFVTDTVEGFIASGVILVAAEQIMNGSVDLNVLLASVGIALAHAGISAARRNADAAKAWFEDLMGTATN